MTIVEPKPRVVATSDSSQLVKTTGNNLDSQLALDV